MREWSEEELAARLAEPCTPSSDISTLKGAEDHLREARTAQEAADGGGTRRSTRRARDTKSRSASPSAGPGTED